VTLAALGEIFEAARAIMSWLGDCAKVWSCSMFINSALLRLVNRDLLVFSF